MNAQTNAQKNLANRIKHTQPMNGGSFSKHHFVTLNTIKINTHSHTKRHKKIHSEHKQ